MTTGSDWSFDEVGLTVSTYFDMLRSEMDGQEYSKAEHRRRLTTRFPHRSDGAVEFKFQNVSAVLADLGLQYIEGYKPRRNRQELLATAVDEFLSASPEVAAQLRQNALWATSTWIADVAAVVEQLPHTFTVEQVYAYEAELGALHPENRNVRSHIRHNLQLLRNRKV